MKSCIVLDVMGVIFKAADDVSELLVPFIGSKGSRASPEQVETVYLQASLGDIDADQFWEQVGLPVELEDEYLEAHRLTSGALDFLRAASKKNFSVWCLSNDLGRWSKKLRDRFQLERFLSGVVISSEVGARKPSAEIYQVLFRESGYSPEEMLFWDDRQKNVETALALGIESFLYQPGTGFASISDIVFDKGNIR